MILTQIGTAFADKLGIKRKTAARRPDPKVGDTRTTKQHGLQIRVWLRARDALGRPYAAVVSRGRPVYAWRSPADLDPWDRHMLEWPSVAAELKKEKVE